MNDDLKSTQHNVDAALKLDGDPRHVRDYYDQWAQSYDADVNSIQYAGPQMAVRLLMEHLKPDERLKLLDAGCGTGLVGSVLGRNGFTGVQGFDLSPAMAERAIATNCYREVKGDIDIMRVREHYAESSFDAVLCVGVFTLGHVPPQALHELIALLKPGGLLVISVRKLYYDESGFQAELDVAMARSGIEIIGQLKDARYNQDGPDETEGLAHYWVLRGRV